VNWLLRFSLVLLLVVVSHGCSDDDGGPTGVATTGSVFVSVRTTGGEAVPKATVHSQPETGRYKTNGAGTVLLDHMKAGTYVIAATHPSIGTGNAAITVRPGNVQNLTIGLLDGIFLQPMVRIMDPRPGREFSFADSITFRAAISDDDDAPETLSLQWTSDIDGGLSTASANASGIAEFTLRGLSLGTHQIALLATDSDGFVGVGTLQVTVRSFPPSITWIGPVPGEGYVPGEPILFRASVDDHETRPDQLSARWSSDVDGVLNETSPTADGSLEFSTSTLSPGIHRITLTVTDADGNETTKGLTLENDLPPRVVLDALDKDVGGVHLSWNPVDGPDFDSYRIYRSSPEEGPFELIQTVDDAQATEYYDTTVTPGVTYWYRIGRRTKAEAESPSNVEEVEAGISIDVAGTVGAMLVDPVRPYLYVLDGYDSALLFVNLDTNELEKKIFVGSAPRDLDINVQDTELFVAASGSKQVAVISLDTQEVVRTFGMTSTPGLTGTSYRLCCLADGNLAYLSEGHWSYVVVASQIDGAPVTSAESFSEADLEASPEGTKFYLGHSGGSSSRISSMELMNGTLIETDSHTIGNSAVQNVVLSGDGSTIFYARHKLSTSDLALDFGTFPETIWACNSDGSIAIGRSNIYDATTFDVIRELPVTGSRMAVAPDDSILYVNKVGTQKILLVDLSTLNTGN